MSRGDEERQARTSEEEREQGRIPPSFFSRLPSLACGKPRLLSGALKVICR